jgi:uncharacterized repeat protein (TIGR03803 family)
MTIRFSALKTGGALSIASMILSLCGEAQTTLTTLYEFSSRTFDGAHPEGIVIGSGGVLYGTTKNGGTSRMGTVFSLTPPASPGGGWTEAVLHNFTGRDGSNPVAGVVIGQDGVLYGTTNSGGIQSCGDTTFGTVFSLTHAASPGGAWTETVLHGFTGVDGAHPSSNLAIGSGGVLYGTTYEGGTSGYGTVYSLTPRASAGGAWNEQVLYSFAGGADGDWPSSGVLIGDGGVLYGTTRLGGTTTYCGNCGAIYSLTPPVSTGDAWTESLIYTFPNYFGGIFPLGDLAIGDGGVLFGEAESGGTSMHGTVFSLTPPSAKGGAWTQVTLHDFAGPPSDGQEPFGGVVIGLDGVLYGITYAGGYQGGRGGYGVGTVFSLTPPGWSETLLHEFAGYPNDGAYPSSLVIGEDGVLYGTTYKGGSAHAGVVFRLRP